MSDIKQLPAIVMWDNGGMNIAIPKRKGRGYLKVPLGHHFSYPLSNIEISERVDASGLDGYLCLEYGFKHFGERILIASRVMPQLGQIYGFTAWRESASEFWRVVMKNYGNRVTTA